MRCLAAPHTPRQWRGIVSRCTPVLPVLALAAGLAVAPVGAGAATVPVNNTATLTYTEANTQLRPTVTSNTVTVSVSTSALGAAVAVQPSVASRYGGKGTIVYYPLAITNRGSDRDAFSLAAESASSPPWTTRIYADDGAGGGIADDGVHQAGETNIVSSTGAVPALGTFRCVAGVVIPVSALDGDVDGAVFTATSQADPRVSATAVLNTTVTSSKLMGKVADRETGQPLVAAVDVFQGNTLVASTVTEPVHGMYEFGDELPDGTYIVSATRPGYAWQARWDIKVTAGAVAYCNLFLVISGVLAGRVTDAVTGLPVPGAAIDVFTTHILRASTVTGADGTYRLNQDLFAGENLVRAGKRGYVREHVVVNITPGVQSYVSIAIAPSGFVTGYVIDDATGVPIAGATVQAFQNGTCWAETTAGSTGTYELERNLAGGTYELVASAPGYADEHQFVSVAPSQTSTAAFHLVTK